MRYLDPKNDLTFKKIFGQHPHLAISLLNSLLPLADDELIVDLEYIDKELVPTLPIFKDSMVDVRCRDSKGRQFIVEMQMLWTDSFKSRVLFNAAKAYVRQLERGKKYDSLEPVYALSIVNDIFEADPDTFYYSYGMVCDHDTRLKIEGLHLVFVELPKFKPQNIVERRLNVLWLRFLKDISEGTLEKDIPAEFRERPELLEALECLQESSFSQAELEYYDKYWDYVRRELSLHDNAYDKGKEEGRLEGALQEKREGIMRAIHLGVLEDAQIAAMFAVDIEFVRQCRGC